LKSESEEDPAIDRSPFEGELLEDADDITLPNG
jgi:hypothetical protein